MIKWFRNIILVLFGLMSYDAYSQTNCAVPLPPVLKSVSVQPETGNTDLTWELSQSTDIAAYILYTYEDGDGMPFDTVWDPSETHFTLSNTASRYSSVSYVVASYRLPVIPGKDGCPSPFSNVMNTIFCTSEIDSCANRIIINWNPYPDYPNTVLEYKILVSLNGSPLTEMYNVGPNDRSYIISEFLTDSQYCFAVEAILEDGSSSGSNKSCISTIWQKPPQWINADYATVNADNKLSLSFTFDQTSEITHFLLERKTGQSGTFIEIAKPVSASGSVLYIDNVADINTVNYYRLSAINNCKIPVTVSNLSSNVVLSLERIGNDLNLSWNSCDHWLGTVLSYTLYINTGSGFEERAVLPPNDTLFTLGYKELMYEVSGSEVCFYISAMEISNPHGIAGQNISSTVCTIPTEIITVPNVFTPNNDQVNDYFRPVLSFTPLDYHLIISDRKGGILFESRDYNLEWDGSQNGDPHAQGVCLWFLKVTTPSGKSISRTGTITIINSH